MGLIMWLPLIKNLKNQGYGDLTYSLDDNVIFSTPGKVGEKCLSSLSNINNTVSMTLKNLNLLLANGKSYSLTCWFKLTGNTNSGWLIKLGLNNCGLYWSKADKKLSWYENDNGKEIIGSSIAEDYNNWHHLAIVIDKTSETSTTIWRYIDGIPIQNNATQTWTTTNIQPAGEIITIYPYKAFFNDIRLYDYSISNVEVQEISQGLILHWKLNNINMIGSDCSGFNNNGILIGNKNIESDSQRYDKSLYLDNSSYLITQNNSFDWWMGNYKQGTISYWAKPTENLNLNSFDTNKWHHYACVFNNTILKLYRDGELVTEPAINWNSFENFNSFFSTSLIFFSYDNENNRYYNTKFIGNYNDIRFYITPLLDKNIKILYNTSMRIDNFQHIHTFECAEDNVAKITKTGLTISQEIKEINILKAQLKKEENKIKWLSSNFIEI